MLYMIIGSVVGIIIGSFLVWKRNIHFVIFVLLNYIITVMLFYIVLNINVKVYYSISNDHTAGTVYAFLLFFGIIAVFVVSVLYFLILGLNQWSRKYIGNNS